jgi:hypothetical protein
MREMKAESQNLDKMKKNRACLLFFLLTTLLSIGTAQAQNPTIIDSLKADSLFKVLNRQPSPAEMEWVKSQIRKPSWIEKIGNTAALLSAIGSLITALFAIAVLRIQRNWQLEREKEAHRYELEKERQTHLYQALHWFEGKTQSRSIGIAVIEANWDQTKTLHKTWIAILTNQAVYLLLESGQDKAAHEIVNLKRIMNLLILNKDKCSFIELELLSDSLEESFKRNKKRKAKNQSEIEEKISGLDLSDEDDFQTLNKWKNIFSLKNELSA